MTAPLDPIGDAEQANAKNRAKVGSARPSSLLYTYGVGAIMDLPRFSVMPAGLADWEPIYRRRATPVTVEEPRLLRAVQSQLGSWVRELRPYPWQPQDRAFSREGVDLGIPARVFPQWLRCTGCDYLGPLPRFEYTNTHPYRPDLARFEHVACPGRWRERRAADRRGGGGGRTRRRPAVPARYLLACANGHLDEFPYSLWVHRGRTCTVAPQPDLKLLDSNLGQGAAAVVRCERCEEQRQMSEAQGGTGRDKLPACRGRHPHLNTFDRRCGLPTTLLMMGASNLWFAVTQSVIVMPRSHQEERAALASRLRAGVSEEKLARYAGDLATLRDVADSQVDLTGVTDGELAAAVAEALAPQPSDEELRQRQAEWDPVELLVPEWDYLQQPARFAQQESPSGLMVTEMPRSRALPGSIDRVIAVNRMKKVNAAIGFTRIDQLDRVGDVGARLVRLTRGRPTWVPATEDRGEGVFLQLDETAVTAWEERIRATALWRAHRESHRRNFRRRFSETAAAEHPDARFPPPRYWLVHTLAHVLLRAAAMSCGYGAASLSERLYAWPAGPDRPPAAGLLICTTASDSDGTLGGLVALSEPDRLQAIVADALRRAVRCSSDPVCGQRTPRHSEDFLHGAACHCCCFASETSCERANRFLDRRFLLTLPAVDDEPVPGFFGTVDGS